MLKLIHKTRYNFTRMSEYYFRDKYQDAIIFTNQKTKWSHEQINIQGTALARGFKSERYIKGDNILVKLEEGQFMEKLVMKIAAANLGLNLISSKAKNQEEFAQQLKKSKARALLFSSYGTIGDMSTIQLLYQHAPSLRQAIPGKQIRINQYKYLRFLIQTDNYPFPGTIFFKKLIKYGNSTDYDLLFECEQQPNAALSNHKDSKRPIFITDPLNQFVFQAAILNSLVNGRIIYCVTPDNFNKISQTFQNQIDHVATEQIDTIDPKVRVYLPKGSKLYMKHENRLQI